MVAVIGGGITGLAAGYELAQRGVSFKILEAAARPGGIIQTDRVDGFTIEAGPDSMLAQKEGALELCNELGLGPRLISTRLPRTAYVLHRGRLHALPSPSILGIPTTLKGIAAYDLLPWGARARMALEPLVRARRGEADESVGSFFRRRFGDSTVGLIADPLLGGIHAGDVESLSIRSLFPRFVEAEARKGSVLRTFRHTRPGQAHFRSLASGMEELVTAIERRLPAGALECGTEVTALRHDAAGWEITAQGAALRASAVILAAPAHVAARLLAPVDQEAAALCAQVPYVSTVSIALAFPRGAVAHPLSGSGFVVARQTNALRITACTWVSSKWPGRSPSGAVLLRAYAGGAADPAAVDLSDEELGNLAARELAGILSITGPPLFARAYRWRNAGAQHNVGQIARVGGIEGRLSRYPGILVAGSGFRSIGIPDCIGDGRAAGAAAAEYTLSRVSE